jgi:hypothetical protein
MTKTSHEKKDNPILQRYVLGLENGKPVGARFPQSELKVFEVVKARNLEAHDAYNEEWTTLAMQLPVGRIYARGKAFIPPIKQALYDQLRAYITSWKTESEKSQAERSAAAAAARESKSSGTKPPTSNVAPVPVASGFPQTWDEIAPGHLVLALDEPGEGYWEAIVIARHKDILELKYRDYPKVKPITRHVTTIALLNPG